MRVTIDEIEVHPHGLQHVFADALRHLPTPLRVEMRVWNHVQSGCFRDVWRLHGLRMQTGKQSLRGEQQYQLARNHRYFLLRSRIFRARWGDLRFSPGQPQRYDRNSCTQLS